jgi:hypothetical protein
VTALTSHRHGRQRMWIVQCGLCGARLAVGTDLEHSRELARRNVVARPCCDGQVTDAMVSDYWLNRDPAPSGTGHLF